MGGVFLYYNKVEISGVNTAKLKVLKESEKTELLRQMRSGDPTAREKLINGNRRIAALPEGLRLNPCQPFNA